MLTGGISFTMQFPMATVKKNALYMLFYKVPLSKNENLFWAIVFFLLI
jgi:hypothetical protein